MGFSGIPPRPDLPTTLQALDLWTSGHADAAILHVSVPYAALLAGFTAKQAVDSNELGLANYYRAKGLRVVITVDATNDLADFPFMEALELSSYPYLGGFADPESLPLDYYARIRAESAMPVLVVEGGWPSISVGAITSSPAEQARYFGYQARLLDSARAVALFQLTFTDLDLSAIPLPPGSILPLFAHLGLVDSALGPKPALSVWDSVLAVPLSP
jgi:hypothetical protein